MWQNDSFRLAKIGQIVIDVHPTTGLAILSGAWGGWMLYGGLSGAVSGILAVILLFGCLLLHEFGHGLLAHKMGLGVSRLTFLPIGLLLEVSQASPRQEIAIALIGPLINLVTGVVLGIVVYNVASLESLPLETIGSNILTPKPLGILIYLTAVNLFLGVFNMLPAFPMDGGRVLRAGLALSFDYMAATRIAAWLGRILALIVGFVGFVGFPPVGLPGDPLLVAVAIIVYWGAHHEEHNVRQQLALVHIEVKDVYQNVAEIISPWDAVTNSLIIRLFKYEQLVPVVIENRVVGILTYQEVHEKSIESLTVAHVMRTDFPVLRLHDTLWVALKIMNSHQLPKLPVVDQDLFQGVLSLDDISLAWRIFPM